MGIDATEKASVATSYGLLPACSSSNASLLLTEVKNDHANPLALVDELVDECSRSEGVPMADSLKRIFDH